MAVTTDRGLKEMTFLSLEEPRLGWGRWGRREGLCVSTAGTERFGHSFSFQYLENS